MNEELPFPYLVVNAHMRNERVIVRWQNCHSLGHSISRKLYIKEARGSFSGLRVEVLKLQSRIQDKLRSPSYYIIIQHMIKVNFFIGFQATAITITTEAHSLSF